MKYEGGVGEGGKGGKLDLITLAALSTQGEIQGRNMHQRIYTYIRVHTVHL
jgi:hypothetical protein